MEDNNNGSNTNDEDAAAAVAAAKTMVLSLSSSLFSISSSSSLSNNGTSHNDNGTISSGISVNQNKRTICTTTAAATAAASSTCTNLFTTTQMMKRPKLCDDNNDNETLGMMIDSCDGDAKVDHHQNNLNLVARNNERRRQIEENLIEAVERLTIPVQAQRVHANIKAALPAAKAETAASLFTENNNTNSQGGIIHPTEHAHEESRARIAAMDGGESFLMDLMTSGKDPPRFTISSYLDNGSRINLLLTSKRMKEEFYAHNNSNTNNITNNNNDDNMKLVREIVISRTGDEGRVRDFFSNWFTNYKNRNNNGLDERLPSFTRLVVDNCNEINGYDNIRRQLQLIEEDCPMEFIQDLDLSSSPGSDDNICAHFPCILSILVPNIRHLNLSNTKYDKGTDWKNEILLAYTRHCPRLEKITWNNNYSGETRNVYRDNKGCIQLNGYEMRDGNNHLTNIEFDDCLFVVDPTHINRAPFRVDWAEIDPSHQVARLHNGVNGTRMFHYCSNKLERVSIKNARYRYSFYSDGTDSAPFLPQEVLIKFVRNAPCLRYFRSNLTQENIAMLHKEKPAIELVPNFEFDSN